VQAFEESSELSPLSQLGDDFALAHIYIKLPVIILRKRDAVEYNVVD